MKKLVSFGCSEMIIKAGKKGAIIHCPVSSLHPGPHGLKLAVVTLSAGHTVQAVEPKEAVHFDG